MQYNTAHEFYTIYVDNNGATVPHYDETEHKAHLFVNDLIMNKGIRYDKIKVYHNTLNQWLDVTNYFIIVKESEENDRD